jgi:3-hydroxyacyl-[acyl-carrier-protein] dehydratase
MLLNDFFIIDDWQPAVASAGNSLDSPGSIAGSARAILRINWGHPIFEGHFPGRPVVPGACLLQGMKELLSMAIGEDVRLTRANQLKFISVIVPDLNETVWLNITWNPSLSPRGWQITAEGTHADEIFFRFKGSFQAGSDYAG